MPVATIFTAKGAIPFSHPLCLGVVGLQAHDHVAFGFEKVDLVIFDVLVQTSVFQTEIENQECAEGVQIFQLKGAA